MYCTVIKHDGHLRTQGNVQNTSYFVQPIVKHGSGTSSQNCGRTAGYSYEGDYYNEITFGQRTRIFTKYR